MTETPAWLTAWRQANPEPAAVQAAQQRRSQGERRGSGTSSAASTSAAPVQRGFAEPQQWGFDGCQRREAVLDVDHNPPRVIRRVGWRLCITCTKPFWSTDTTKIRMCDPCKDAPAIRKPLRP